MPKRRILIALISLFIGQSIKAMVYDNRFFPLLQLPYVTMPDRNSYVTSSLFVTTASKLFQREDNEVGLPELWGNYDQGKVAHAIECTGKPNLLLPVWRNYELHWHMEGKLQSQGCALSFHKTIGDWFFVGINTMFMRVNARTEFSFDEESPNRINESGNRLELDEIRRRMNDQLNLCADHISQVGFGDFDTYIGVLGSWDYPYKFKHIYTDFRFGMLVPTGVKWDINKLGSVPFGGNGHWGIYASNWSEFEVKEDWKAGFLLRVSRRLQKIQCMRIPVKGEPLLFGATTGAVKVDPAPTLTFAPYFSMENLRDGLGLRVVYTLRYHGEDYWCDARKGSDCIPVDLTQAQERTSWNADYFTLNAFYDFGKTKVDREFAPIIYAAWDVPSAMLATKRIAKTHRISLGIQLTF